MAKLIAIFSTTHSIERVNQINHSNIIPQKNLVLSEFHATIVENTPEALLDELCPNLGTPKKSVKASDSKGLKPKQKNNEL